VRIEVPELSLVVLIGASGSGKSTFAARHFRPTEVLSSDFCRGLVADDQNAQDATPDAFDVLHYIAGKRLAAGRLTVADATNVHPQDRAQLVALARAHHVPVVAIVFDVPLAVSVERNAARPDRDVPLHALKRQHGALRKSLRGLKREGFGHVFLAEEGATVERVRLWVDRRDLTGPFDCIGDVHGCHDELVALLGELGYSGGRHPQGRTAVFLGDLVDRGPATPAVLRLVMDMVAKGSALCVPGNHDVKLVRALRGRDVRRSHGLQDSLDQLAAEPEGFRAEVVEFLDGLVSHLVLDGGRLVVAHAGLKEAFQGRASREVRSFALYGDTTGESDEWGLPVRLDWARDYRGRATVAYGHTPVAEPEWVNNTINVDTGCVFGGCLTALRYPERELVSVAAARTYYEPSRPFLPVASAGVRDDLLDVDDVLGKRIVATRLAGNVTVPAEHAAAALEVMSRFAIDPRWLLHLPPTMAPCDTAQVEGFLEHPREAFAWYRQRGVPAVVCEEKHMGSRALAVLARDPQAARRRFGTAALGACHTRTGRRFFPDGELEAAFLGRLHAAVGAAGLWDELATDWLLLDAELLPWSAKAQDLILTSFAPVAAAGRAGLRAAVDALERAGAGDLLAHYRARAEAVDRYTAAYRQHAGPVRGLSDLRFAPFALLASEGRAHLDRPHAWHLAIAARLADADPALVLATRSVTVDLTDPAAEAAATAWWQDLVTGGGEGIVVKPADGHARDRKGLLQPALKVRGPEYLRIVYGPEYRTPEHLARLRQRTLGVKRRLALREFALGAESLERFVRAEPLHRVHECVFAVLALESQPVDPRL
jgi:protein phosphatase